MPSAATRVMTLVLWLLALLALVETAVLLDKHAPRVGSPGLSPARALLLGQAAAAACVAVAWRPGAPRGGLALARAASALPALRSALWTALRPAAAPDARTIAAVWNWHDALGRPLALGGTERALRDRHPGLGALLRPPATATPAWARWLGCRLLPLPHAAFPLAWGLGLANPPPTRHDG